MAVTPGGPLSMSAIVAEHGGSYPASLGLYYRGLIYVDDNTFNQGIPTTGPLSYSDFYGSAANLPDENTYISDGTVDDITYAVWGGTLGVNADVSYVMPTSDGNGFITRGGVNSVGSIYPAWLGGSGNMNGNSNVLSAYFNSQAMTQANNYPYLKISLYSNSGESWWVYQNPVFSTISGVAAYMTGGTIISSGGILAGVDPADYIASSMSGTGPEVTDKDLAQNWLWTFNP